MHEGLSDILRDAELPDSVRPGDPSVAERPKTALITGATGFLGRHVVVELMQTTNLHLVLLIRGSADKTADDRWLETIAGQCLTDKFEHSRISVVSGDVAKAQFGLDANTYRDLAKRTDEIFHCAAAVDWVRDYDRLRQTNVGGVRNVINFACEKRGKRIVFASSIAVCMSEGRSDVVAEDTPLLPMLAGMPLGYARSKVVAEALLSQAAERGVPVTVIRPPIIAGHSETGVCNPTDILAAMIQACIHSGLGPDTNWTFDIAPVDYVARVMAQVPQGDTHFQVLNLKQAKSRSWTNFLTWVNLHGYPVRPVPIDEWITKLFEDRLSRGLMISTQRQYFAGRAARAGETGWVRPFRTYLADRYELVDSRKTLLLLEAIGISAPEIGTSLLHRYFNDMRRLDILPPVTAANVSKAISDKSANLGISSRCPTTSLLNGSSHKIGETTGVMNQLSAARRDNLSGVWAVDRPTSMICDGEDRRAVLKIKPHGNLLREQTTVLAGVTSQNLARLLKLAGDPFDLSDTHLRELAIYENAQLGIEDYRPKFYGAIHADAPDRWSILLEYLSEAERLEDVDWLKRNNSELLEVVDNLSEFHGTWFGKTAGLDERLCLGRVPELETVTSLFPLWQELTDIAQSQFALWQGPEIAKVQSKILRDLSDWWARYEALPRTLIHNDFNPRNFALRRGDVRRRLCIFDWELAAIGPPQRDLAELLCFSWNDAMRTDDLNRILERARRALIRSSGKDVDPYEWRQGFAVALLCIFMTRLPMYVLVSRLTPVDFLVNAVRNWLRLYQACEGRSWI